MLWEVKATDDRMTWKWNKLRVWKTGTKIIARMNQCWGQVLNDLLCEVFMQVYGEEHDLSSDTKICVYREKVKDQKRHMNAGWAMRISDSKFTDSFACR